MTTEALPDDDAVFDDEAHARDMRESLTWLNASRTPQSTFPPWPKNAPLSVWSTKA